MEYVKLNNGVKTPKAGFGVYQISKDECEVTESSKYSSFFLLVFFRAQYIFGVNNFFNLSRKKLLKSYLLEQINNLEKSN